MIYFTNILTRSHYIRIMVSQVTNDNIFTINKWTGLLGHSNVGIRYDSDLSE